MLGVGREIAGLEDRLVDVESKSRSESSSTSQEAVGTPEHDQRQGKIALLSQRKVSKLKKYAMNVCVAVRTLITIPHTLQVFW